MFLTQPLRVRLLTVLKVVDDSALGRQALEARKKVKCIHVYNGNRRPKGGLGDKVLVTIMGQMKKGYVTGLRQAQHAFIPRFDSNNVVLVDDKNVPLGKRIHGPIPNMLRRHGADTARIMAIATKFV